MCWKGINIQKATSPFFTRGKHEILDVSYISQRYFEIPLIIRINSNNFLFEQTAKVLQISFKDIDAFGIDCEELKQLCNESWKDTSSNLKYIG